MPCPRCGLRDASGNLLRGIKRSRAKTLPGERLYRCQDCSVLWRMRDGFDLTEARETIETTAETLWPALGAANAETSEG